MLKKLIPVFIMCATLYSCVSYHDDYRMRPVYVAPGIGLGTLIAVVVSWSRNKSILLAILHGLLGWLYVVYALLVKKKD